MVNQNFRVGRMVSTKEKKSLDDVALFHTELLEYICTGMVRIKYNNQR